MGNKSYFTYKRAEQEEILKKIEENYKLLWNMWKKYGRMGEKRKVVSKCYLTFSESSMVTKKTKNKRRRKMKFLPKPKEVKLCDCHRRMHDPFVSRDPEKGSELCGGNLKEWKKR